MKDGSDVKPTGTKRNSLLAQSLISVGSAALSSVNAITPHLAGAVDILVVLQPDGITYKSTPFYVRFGKYAPIRNRERDVKIIINDDQFAGFKMHLGSYGHAYLLEPANGDEVLPESSQATNDDKERAEKAETIEELLPGMMSPATVYSSEDEEEPKAGLESESPPRRRGKLLLPDTALGITDALIKHQQQQRDLDLAAPSTSQGSEGQSQFGFPARGSSPPSHNTLSELSPSKDIPATRGTLEGTVWWKDKSQASLEHQPQPSLSSLEHQPQPSLLSLEHQPQPSLLSLEHQPQPSLSSLEHQPQPSLSSSSSLEHQPQPSLSSSSLPLPTQTSPRHKREASFAIDEESLACVTNYKKASDPRVNDTGRSMPISIQSPNPLLSSRQVLSPPATPAKPLHSEPSADISQHEEFPQLQFQEGSEGCPGAASNLVSLSSSLFLPKLELSECGVHLSSMLGLSPRQVLRVFESHRVQEEVFRNQGAQLLSSPHLMVRIGDMIYPWRAASPMVVGAFVFGRQFDNLIPKDTPRWGPLPPRLPSNQASRETVESSRSKRSISLGRGGRSLGGGSASDTLPSVRYLDSDGRLMGLGRLQVLPADSSIDIQPHSERGASPSSSWTFWPFLGAKRDLVQVGTGGEGGRGGAGSSGVVKGSLSDKEASGEGEERELSRAASDVADDSEGKSSKAPQRKAPTSQPPLMMRKTLTPTSEQLSSLGLKPGRNQITYRIGTTALSAYVYLLNWDTKLVISDVDGTITRSDVLGHILPAIGWDWSHKGISQLFTNVVSHGYQIMYLSSRSIGQANITRDYLNTIVQKGEGKEGRGEQQHRMPLGPVIISPDGILPSLYREMVLRRPHEFKIATLQDIRSLFPSNWNPFYAGFGNRNTDEISYKAVGVPISRIFIINPKGELREATTNATDNAAATTAIGSMSSLSPNQAEASASSLAGKVSMDSNTLGSVSSLGAGSVWSLRDINESISELFPPIRTPPEAIGKEAMVAERVAQVESWSVNEALGSPPP